MLRFKYQGSSTRITSLGYFREPRPALAHLSAVRHRRHFASCFWLCLPTSQLLTKTFQAWAFVLTLRRSSIGETHPERSHGVSRKTYSDDAEDNPLIVESYEDVVTDAGLSVGGSFFSSKSAEEWLSVHNPDVAILDVTLQDGSSARLAKKLCGREIPFLVVSGCSAESEDIDEIFKSALWLEKPVTTTALESALRSLIAS